MTAAARLCMECRYRPSESLANPSASDTKRTSKEPVENILEHTYLMNPISSEGNDESLQGILNSLIRTPQTVLQELDINRLRAIIYRDVVRQDRNKSGKNVVFLVVNRKLYFIFFFSAFCLSMWSCYARVNEFNGVERKFFSL